MILHIVTFNYEGDGVTALYIDGVKHTHGDYYHDKINDWIEGFCAGLKKAGVTFAGERHYIPADKCKPIHELGHEPPSQWPDKRKRYYKHIAKELTKAI